MKKLLLIGLLVITMFGCRQKLPNENEGVPPRPVPTHIDQCIYPMPGEQAEIVPPSPVKAFYSTAFVPEEQELAGVSVPVPRNCRILNTKGSCVWCSLELAGRYAEIKELYDITKNPRDGGDPRCQGGSSPSPVRAFLNDKHIKYEMIEDKSKTDWLVQKVKIERRPVCFAIPGHMLSLVHYDPDTKMIKVIDNADHTLSVQQWSWDKFHRLWSGWAYVIYGEPDIIPFKYNPWNLIPIIDGATGEALPMQRDYFPIPK